MAPPLAGSMKMKYGQFFLFDTCGTVLYCMAYASAGFIFSQFLSSMLHGLSAFGHMIEWLLAFAFVGFLVYRFYLYWTHRQYRVVPRVQAEELATRLGNGDGKVIVADVRSHGYYDKDAERIRGSIRLEPNNLNEFIAGLPEGVELYLYCT